MARFRLALLACCALLAAGCSSSQPTAPTVAPARTYPARRIPAAAGGGAGRGPALVHDQAALGQAADRVQARARPAHRSAPDRRAARPERDRSPAPVDSRRRADPGNDQIAEPRSLPRVGGRLPGEDAQLPTAPGHPGRRGVPPPPAAPLRPGRDPRRLPGRARRAEDPARNRACVLRRDDHRPPGPAGSVHTLVRRAGPRDLLPVRLARLLPHACLRAGDSRLHEHFRRREGHRGLTAPGKARVGVLLPVAGTWRLFLQFQANGRIITAPFTLRVR